MIKSTIVRTGTVQVPHAEKAEVYYSVKVVDRVN